MDMFVAIGTLNTLTSHSSIFNFKLKHEQRKTFTIDFRIG